MSNNISNLFYFRFYLTHEFFHISGPLNYLGVLHIHTHFSPHHLVISVPVRSATPIKGQACIRMSIFRFSILVTISTLSSGEIFLPVFSFSFLFLLFESLCQIFESFLQDAHIELRHAKCFSSPTKEPIMRRFSNRDTCMDNRRPKEEGVAFLDKENLWLLQFLEPALET